MRKLTMLAVGCALLLATAPAAQQNALQTAAKALGADGLYSLQVAGSGAMFTVGQPYAGGGPWPRVNVKSYLASYNFDTGSSRLDLVREMPNPIPQGGGGVFTGQQTQNLFYSGNFAWNGLPPAPPMPPPPAAPGAPAGGGGGGQAAPARGGAPAGGGQAAAPAAPAIPPGPPPQAENVVVERRLALWSTPQGFVKAALANNATTRAAGGNTEVSFLVDKKYRMTGTINAAGDVLSVRTTVPNPVFGDMAVETTYSGYKDFAGVRFPAQITQTQGGHPAFEISVSNVTLNPVVSVIIPPSVYMAPSNPPITVASQEVAPGVFYLTGGSHHSLAINQADHIVIVDLPLNIARGEAVIAKAKELIPNKPVRYVINTHPHFDHSSGLRAGVAESAAIVTHSSNQAFFSRALGTRATLIPDKAAGRPVRVQGVGARGSLTDGKRRIEMYQIMNNNHSLGFLMVYLPTEKILFEADAYTPGAASAPLPTAPVPNAQALADNITRLKLDVAQILAAHGPRVATMADLNQVAAIGRK
jgi:glyoxylase-like metal-dependent hydrolase (beta-lactamase superfamily II)